MASSNVLKCFGCNKIINRGGSINCNSCKQWFHKRCCGLDSVSFNKFAAEFKIHGQINWTCQSCTFEVSIIESDSEEDGDGDDLNVSLSLTNRIEHLFRKHLAPFAKRMETIESNVAGIRSELNKLADNTKVTAKQFTQLSKRISAVEDKVNSGGVLSATPDSIISEIYERRKCETKVIVLNVPESDKPAGTDRLLDDRVKLSTIIPQEISNSLPNMKLRRLGRATEGKTRPLLIDTPSVNEARILLKSKPAEGSGVAFKQYLTPLQQKHLRELRNELNTLVDNGDTNKTIKYVNGVPKIVDKHTFHPPKAKTKH